MSDRQIAEMLGLAKGIICDGVLNDAEVVAVKQWLRENPDVTVCYPGNYLAERVVSMWADGEIDEGERQELATLLADLTGEPLNGTGTMRESTALPLTSPQPTVIFDNRTFVFTGVCASGHRALCAQRVEDRGGRFENAITNRTDYLVIGVIPSERWVQSSHGRKIEKAADMRREGHRIAIISEQHWLAAVNA